jgi:hypothetical protein
MMSWRVSWSSSFHLSTALSMAKLKFSLAQKQGMSSLAHPDPRMPELIADLAHAGIPAGAWADVETAHIRIERRQRCMFACIRGAHLILKRYDGV